MKTLLRAASVCAFLAATSTMAQPVPPPEQNVGNHHGNIEAAQSLTRQAWDRLSEAQRDNHGEAGGHLRRAKELLDQASAEMKAAAVYLNHR